MSGPSEASAPSRRFEPRSILLWFQRNTIVALILLLLAFIAAVELLKPGTVNPVWLSNTLLFAAPLGILAAGQTMVMLTGGIDLSVVSVATGSAFLMTTTALKFGNLTAVAIGLGLGLAGGSDQRRRRRSARRSAAGDDARHRADDARHHHRLQPEDPGVALDRAGLHPCHRLRSAVRHHSFRPVSVAADRGAGGGHAAQTGFGRLLYAIGDNREGCRLAGVRVWRLLLIDYIVCALLASIAGFVLVGHTNSADLSLASTYLLPSIAAVIIGGTSIFGGRGGYSGTIIGALILTVLDGLLTLLNSPEPIKQILYGAIIFTLAAAYSRLTA